MPLPEPDAADRGDVVEAAYLFALGKLLADESSFREAQRAFERSLELDGSDPYGWVELAEFHAEMVQLSRSAEKRRQHLEKAAEYVESAREMAPEDVDVLHSYARIYLRLGEHRMAPFHRAQEAYELLREKTEGDLVVLSSLGQIYLWKREPEKAVEVLEEAASYLPGHRMIQTMLVDALLGAGENEKAERALSQLVGLRPDSHEDRIRLAELRSQLDDHRGAVEALEGVPQELLHEERIRHFLARELHLAGENPEALRIVDSLIGESSDDGGGDESLHRLRIAVLTSMARYRDALAELEPLLASADEEEGLQDSVLLSRLLERVGRTEEAAQRLRALIAASSGRQAFQLKLALVGVLERQGLVDEAVEVLRQELTVASTERYALVANALSQTLERAGRDDEAVQVLAEASSRLVDESPQASLGLELRKLTQLAGLERWEELAQLTPELLASDNAEVRASARQLRAEALAGLGRFDEALDLLAPGEGNDADTGAARLLLAKRVDLLFQYDRAEEAAALVAELAQSGDPDDLFFAARLYQRALRYADVVVLMRRYLAAEPESLQALFLLGASQERTGVRGDAITTFKRLLELAPDHSATLNYLGYMWAEQGEKLDEALDLILRANALDPDNGAYVDSLGWVYYRLGRLEEAREHLEWAARLIPTDATIFEHLGDLYLQLEEVGRAREYYEQAVKLDGDNLDDVREKLENLDEEGL